MGGLGILALIVHFFLDLYDSGKERIKDAQLRQTAINKGQDWYVDVNGKMLTINYEPFIITVDNGDRVWKNTINGRIIKNISEERRKFHTENGLKHSGRFVTTDPLRGTEDYYEFTEKRRLECGSTQKAIRNGDVKHVKFNGYHLTDTKTGKTYVLEPVYVTQYFYALINTETGYYDYLIAACEPNDEFSDRLEACMQGRLYKQEEWGMLDGKKRKFIVYFRDAVERCLLHNSARERYGTIFTSHSLSSTVDCWPIEMLDLSKINFVANLITKKVEWE